MPKLKYVGGGDSVDLPDGRSVKRNHVVEVSDDVAGQPPDAELNVVMVELAVAADNRDHLEQSRLRAKLIPIDRGSGLLAQVDNWQLVTKKDEKPEA